MYSIPPKQFAISQGVPHIFSHIISHLQRGWQRCHLLFKEKRGGGYHFWRAKGTFFLWKHTPLCFPIQKVGGYIYD